MPVSKVYIYGSAGKPNSCHIKRRNLIRSLRVCSLRALRFPLCPSSGMLRRYINVSDHSTLSTVCVRMCYVCEKEVFVHIWCMFLLVYTSHCIQINVLYKEAICFLGAQCLCCSGFELVTLGLLVIYCTTWSKMSSGSLFVLCFHCRV